MTARGHNFDRVAPLYDFAKTVLLLGAIQRCQYRHLAFLKDSKHILVLGGGTGKIIGRIREFSAFDKMVYVDSSSKMIERSRMYIRRNYPGLIDKIQFKTNDIVTHVTESKYDAVVAPFIFDCLTDSQLGALRENLATWLQPEGLLIFSDFHESKSSMISRSFSQAITRPLYLALTLMCGLPIKRLPNFENFFEGAKLTLIEEHQFFFGVLRSAVYKQGS